ERNLINEIARQVGLIVEHWETEQETARLQEQLRHADRLATVGQLSAGVAHELNEPLVAILGFAQLLKGSPDLSNQAARDVEKIINASLHAREIIRKLMLFTRQMPARKAKCDFNQLISEGLYFLESRCAKEGIVIIRELEDGLPQFLADQSQLYQVLVNLAVNAVQAMPQGGKLTIRTRSDAENVYMTVEDTGIGMNAEVQKQLFIPFFTTKDVGQGTGLGLAVVHGIISAHGGSITVNSVVGKGSTFEVRLPLNGPANAKE
ncbi:MAG: ATP-binding protein, partial [candidate division Zixibacteria bacterium]|nr:ATP-binding protein [candidate division Zixibacteria bacterium]